MERVNCIHATRLTGTPASRCALGLFDGRPRLGQCVNQCGRRAEVEAGGPAILPRVMLPLPKWDESAGAGVEVERWRLITGDCCDPPRAAGE